MLTILSVSLGILTCSCVLLGSPLVMSPSKCVLLSTSKMVRKGMKDRVLSQDDGLSSLMSGMWEGIWVLSFEDGLRLKLLGFVLFFLVWFLSLLFSWIFMVGFVWSGLCIFLLVCIGLRLLSLLLTASGGFGLLFTGWFGLVVSL